MRQTFLAPISVAFAMAVGLVVLLGYFVDFPLLASLREVFLRWAVILTAVALLVGIINLASVHWQRLTGGQAGGVYSGITLVALIATLVVAGFFGPTGDWSRWIFNYIEIPIETSLLAILTVVLAYASARVLRRRLDWATGVFVVTILLVLLGTATIPIVDVPELRDLRLWISQVLAAAGARGILLGIALGTVATGLRILTGSDRPYGG